MFLPKWRLNQDIPVVKENVSGDDNEAKLVDRQAGEGGHRKSQAGHLFKVSCVHDTEFCLSLIYSHNHLVFLLLTPSLAELWLSLDDQAAHLVENQLCAPFNKVFSIFFRSTYNKVCNILLRFNFL